MFSQFINPIEYEFRLQFGCYPYDFYKSLRDNGISRKEASERLQERIHKVWTDMKYTHSRASSLEIGMRSSSLNLKKEEWFIVAPCDKNPFIDFCESEVK